MSVNQSYIQGHTCHSHIVILDSDTGENFLIYK